ncbi:C4-dicarboxylate ABC transporter [Inhella sp.]|uniref:SLAC1 family transporter n=1 Tax=Inhella sp. TaxID=1921806 RepID=UPI0035B41E40
MQQSLKHLGPGNFAMVMGLAGLALAWKRAEGLMGEQALQVAAGFGALAALAFVALGVASLLRWQRHPEAWLEDFRHPVRHAFVAALPVSLILVSTVAWALFGPHPLTQALWMLGCAAQFGVTVWVLARFLKGPATGMASLTPVLIIPVVGNVLAPLAGVGLGLPNWAAAQFGLGLLLWPLVMGLLLLRLVQQGMWPERLLATSFITVAPPAVVGLSALQLGAPEPLAWMAWGMALGFLLVSGSVLGRVRRQGFALPWWGMSFPLAAFAALSLRLQGGLLGILLLALASVVVVGLLLATWRAARAGQLWVPEPVATLQPATP